MTVATFLALLVLAAGAEPCRVLDPELQESYHGGCVDGLADGHGYARGRAEYEGEFRAGRKHGRGVKRWANGDRYEGDWADDMRHGVGTYRWGSGPWAGESYEGGFRNDRRHGYGIYRWPSGDVYAGAWEDDRPTGPATPMMRARAKYEEEARKALARKGQRVCRAMAIGLARQEWVRGVVVDFTAERVAVRVDEPGRAQHVIAGVAVRAGDIVWDEPTAWTPCH